MTRRLWNIPQDERINRAVMAAVVLLLVALVAFAMRA